MKMTFLGWTAQAVAVKPLGEAVPSRSFLTLEGAAAVVEALKPAEDGRGFILRIYEPHGARGEVVVRAGVPVRAVRECNLVEQDGPAVRIDGNSFAFTLTPFQIRTFRLMTRTAP